MKTVGLLLNAKGYFLPYVSWLLQNQKSIGYEIVGVHTNDSFAVPKNLLCSSFEDIIEKSDLVVSLSYWEKISKESIDKVPMGIINFHHSYKLKYKGRHCATWALKNQEKIHGSTMHFIDENLDCGKIIDTDFFEIEASDVAEDLFYKANDVGLTLLKRNFQKIISDQKIEFKPMSEDSFTFKEKDLNHEISLDKIQEPENLLHEIKSLSFHGCPAPFVVIDGVKIFLKTERYDSGKLERQSIC